MKTNLIILTPVYNDWDCFQTLVQHINATSKEFRDIKFKVIAVDDGSEEAAPKSILQDNHNVHILTLGRNVGHQRAIAIGICYLNDHIEFDHVIVMDSDGEDKPENIQDLLKKIKEENKPVFASRRNRYESSKFKLFYKIYKKIFKILSGHEINFGNFSILPSYAVQKIVLYSEFWNHYSGAIIKSKIKYNTIKLDRGTRYVGKSKMNFNALVLHGFSSISVFLDTVALRLLLTSGVLIITLTLSIFFIIYLKTFTNYSIPGWASTVGLNLLSLIFLLFTGSLIILFLVLNKRSSQEVIPKNIYNFFIKEFK